MARVAMISRRDHFAAQALSGLLAGDALRGDMGESKERRLAYLSTVAFEIADAMIEHDPESDPGDSRVFYGLPVDLAEAVEQFKLAIVRHSSDEWLEVTQARVLAVLSSLVAMTRGGVC